MPKKSSAHSEFPEELAAKLGEMDKRLKNLETSLEPILCTSVEESYHDMSAIDRAKYDLVSAYAINSLFWAYLRTRGEDSKEHGIKGELDRLKTSMLRVKDIADRAKAMKMDKAAVNRMVTKSLWKAKDSVQSATCSAEGCVPPTPDNPSHVLPPWWTDECRIAIRARNRAKSKLDRNNTAENVAAFRKARSTARWIVRESKNASCGAGTKRPADKGSESQVKRRSKS